jgi:hypothetical protein
MKERSRNMSKQRVRYAGGYDYSNPELVGAEGLAEADSQAGVKGLYEGLWYFEPDDKSLLQDDSWGGFCVAEEELEFLDEG